MYITGLLHVGLEVPSLKDAEQFYSDFGLQSLERRDTLAFRCQSRDQDQLLVAEAPRKRLHHVAFSVASGALSELRKRLVRAQIPLVDPPRTFAADGLWVTDPEGGLVNLREAAQAPHVMNRSPYNMGGVIERTDRPLWREITEMSAAPRRLGHSLIFTSNLDRAEHFYVNLLGLRISDRISGLATFLNTGPGDHHRFGLISSTHRGLHHLSFEVDGFDNLLLGAQTMAEKGHHTSFGFGRHDIGSNLFHYIQDPWGSWTEYFTDMDQISENWQPADWTLAGPPALWYTGTVPTTFLTNKEPPPGE